METAEKDQLWARQRYRRAICSYRLVLLAGHLSLADAFEGFSSCPLSGSFEFYTKSKLLCY